MSVVKWILATFLSHSLSSEAYWLRENPSMKARLKPRSRITAWGRFRDWHMLHTLPPRAFSDCKLTNTGEPMAATLDHWTQDDEEWTFRMGILFPDAIWEDFWGCMREAVLWTSFAEGGQGGLMWCEWDRRVGLKCTAQGWTAPQRWHLCLQGWPHHALRHCHPRRPPFSL